METRRPKSGALQRRGNLGTSEWNFWKDEEGKDGQAETAMGRCGELSPEARAKRSHGDPGGQRRSVKEPGQERTRNP